MLGFEHSFVVDSKGLSGGLAFLWRENIEVSLESYSKCHISLKVYNSGGGQVWLMTGFYGQSMTSRRSDSWKLLRALKPPKGVPWHCMEDFNEILH